MSNMTQRGGVSVSTDCPPCPGSPVVERIETRDSRLGENLTIRRALPSRQRRMVGAWCFLDHAGPMAYGRGGGLAVGPHPHIGLQTFSWMIEGEILHRDSLGCEQIIRPGQVNLMTAGRGISHSEDAASDAPGRIHLAQLWIALPDAERHRPPAFEHYPELPVLDANGVRITLLAGSAFGATSPAAVYTPLLGLDLRVKAAARTALPLNPVFEHAAMVLAGTASVAGETVAPGTLLYLGSGREGIEVALGEDSQVLLLGGEPFEEEVLLWWNFVAREPAEIEEALADWQAGRRFERAIGSPTPPLEVPERLLGSLRLK